MRTKIRLITTSRRGSICLGKQLNPPFHAPPRTRSPLSVYRPGGIPHATRVWHRLRPLHIARFYLDLELRRATHARLVAPSLAIPLRARLSVGRSAARGTRPRRESDRPHPLRHPSRRISLGSRRSSARCARKAPDSPLRVVSACDNAYQLINAPQSLKPKGFSVIHRPSWTTERAFRNVPLEYP